MLLLSTLLLVALVSGGGDECAAASTQLTPPIEVAEALPHLRWVFPPRERVAIAPPFHLWIEAARVHAAFSNRNLRVCLNVVPTASSVSAAAASDCFPFTTYKPEKEVGWLNRSMDDMKLLPFAAYPEGTCFTAVATLEANGLVMAPPVSRTFCTARTDAKPAPTTTRSTSKGEGKAAAAASDLVRRVEHAFAAAEARSSRANLCLSIPGMSGTSFRHFLSALFDEIDGEDKARRPLRYLEVGLWAGSTLSCALEGRSPGMLQAVGVDNWSQFAGGGWAKEAFFANTKAILFSTSPGVEFHVFQEDFFTIPFEQLLQAAQGPLDIYLFDGPHSASEHYRSLPQVIDALADTFILIVDDANYDEAILTTEAAVKHLELEVVFRRDIPTAAVAGTSTQESYGGWHNGVSVWVLQKKSYLRPRDSAAVSAAAAAAAGE